MGDDEGRQQAQGDCSQTMSTHGGSGRQRQVMRERHLRIRQSFCGNYQACETRDTYFPTIPPSHHTRPTSHSPMAPPFWDPTPLRPLGKNSMIVPFGDAPLEKKQTIACLGAARSKQNWPCSRWHRRTEPRYHCKTYFMMDSSYHSMNNRHESVLFGPPLPEQ